MLVIVVILVFNTLLYSHTEKNLKQRPLTPSLSAFACAVPSAGIALPTYADPAKMSFTASLGLLASPRRS